MARVVLDARAGAVRAQQLEVVLGPLLEPLRLEQLALRAQHAEALPELRPDTAERRLEPGLGRHEVLGRIERQPVHDAERLAGDRVHGR